MWHIYLLPVMSITDVVEVPAGGEDGLEAACCHLAHLVLPATLPHINHCVWKYLVGYVYNTVKPAYSGHV